MEVKLEDLIEKIKKEGVGEAKKISAETIEKAKEESTRIINDAKSEAAGLMEKAKKEAAQFKKNAEDALKQASRDLILNLKERLKELFDRIIKRDFSQDLTPEFLKEMIVKIVDNWSPGKDLSLELIVSDKDKQRLEELVLSHFKDEAKNTITIKASSSIDKGFRIGIKGEEIHYDFSDESILESLKELLNPAIAKVLDSGEIAR